MAEKDYTLAGLRLQTPIINAAGSVNGISPENILREVGVLAATDIGAITVGSFTVLPQEGNEPKYGTVYVHDPEAGATFNSMGLPNIGLRAAEKLLPDLRKIADNSGKPLIASVSPTTYMPEIGDTFEQTINLVYYSRVSGADLVEVNTSCPNVVTEDGGRKPILGYDYDGMVELVESLGKWAGGKGRFSRTGVKLPPYRSQEEISLIPKLAQLFKDSGVFSFIVTANTIPGQQSPMNIYGEPTLGVPGGLGGKSGQATADEGRRQLALWKDVIGDQIDIVSTLGVYSGKEVAVRRELGATTAGFVTLLWESRDWQRSISDTIFEWVEAGQP